MFHWWDNFFHARTKVNTSGTDTNTSRSTFVLCGRLRIVYALLLLYDRYILLYDFDWFYLSGIMPCKQHYRATILPYSILCDVAYYSTIIPTSYIQYLYYTMFYLGILNAILLLLGIYPKVQLLLLHLNMLSFHNHSDLMWDGEDVMFKLWNFLFLFLPLNHITIYDKFCGLFYDRNNDTNKNNVKSMKTRKSNETTWPMWPFRLWQIEICCIYIGAGYSKLATYDWSSGNALYRVCAFYFVDSFVLLFFTRYKRIYDFSHNLPLSITMLDNTYERFFWWTNRTGFYI
jgi:hypothetical protein